MGGVGTLNLMNALMASGFKRIPDNRPGVALLPCARGTFSNVTTRGANGCTKCSPGGFYSDDVGYVATSCKQCPNGSFVSFEKAPGTRKQDCKSCPEGTETDFFAGFRACKCLEGFYRTHMFKQCYKCTGGLKCKDDYVSLKFGYWWKWRNETQKHRYRDFMANLLTSSPKLDASSVQFPFSIPIPYRCPREESCKGGLDSQCEKGFEGPLCAVCSSGYYKRFETCLQCPSKHWIVGQLSIILLIVLIIIAVLVLTIKRMKKGSEKMQLLDMLLSKLKIVIGFYQVTYGLLEAFSYIKWPNSLQSVAKYSEILRMDVLQIAPLNCLSSGLRLDAFGSLITIVTINAAVIGFSAAAYNIRKALILRNRSLEPDEKSRSVSQAKEIVYRNLFFFLYVTFLGTCVQTANVLPLACKKLCQDEQKEHCSYYMKADYSIRCQGTKYNNWLVLAYISTAYIFVLPISAFVALWKRRRLLALSADDTVFQDPGSGTELISGLSFLFQNYNHRSWYWELVEISRKVILTSGLILVGQESRSYIGLAWVIAGMYGMLFSWIKPIKEDTENRLMATSLAVTVVNLGIGAVSRIPAENLPASEDSNRDDVLFKLLILGANSSVIGLLAVQYAMFLYGFLKEWRQNPHWSFSCCLGLVLPLSDLRGEIQGMVDSNVLKNQLQTGQDDKPTILAVIKASGAIDVTLDEDEQVDEKLMKTNAENQVDNRDSKCHQGTQTELVSISEVAIHKQNNEVSIESRD